jgi:signal peptidase I
MFFKKKEKKKEKKHPVKEFFASLIFALVVAGFIRTFTFEPYAIPSGSMFPTMLIGDYLYISKAAYGYSKYSFPFIYPDFIKGRFMDSMPERGDVVVMKVPGNESINYIKRLVGLPGDRIQVKKGILYINGEAAPQERVEDYEERMPSGRIKKTPQFIEVLPNGKRHLILREDVDGMQNADNTKEYSVPEGHFFMMGDNRNNSRDSRADLGFVPYGHLLGPAKFIFFSIENSVWDLIKVHKWPEIIRFDRIFSGIDYMVRRMDKENER